jgi:hypothetical protein
MPAAEPMRLLTKKVAAVADDFVGRNAEGM